MKCTALQIFVWRLDKENEIFRACSTYGHNRHVYRILMGKPEVKYFRVLGVGHVGLPYFEA
jgi:hypothetical protein